jgi:hypothetical protein
MTFEQARGILRHKDEGLLAHFGATFQCGSIDCGSVPAVTVSLCETDQRKAEARHKRTSPNRVRGLAAVSTVSENWTVMIASCCHE